MTRQLDPQLRAEAAADRDRLVELSPLERRARARWTATQKLQHLRPDQRELLVRYYLTELAAGPPRDDPALRDLYAALGGDPSGLRA